MTTTSPRKHDFSRLYVADDPRGLVAELSAMDYRVPTHGAVLFRTLVERLGLRGPVLDLACSYGYGSALLNHDVTFDDLAAHYDAATGLDRDDLVAADRAFLAGRRRTDAVPVVGLDTSGPAVRYGVDAGMLDAGVVADLERPTTARTPAPDLAALRGLGAVTVTGATSYVGARTYERVLEAAGTRPWVAGFALRWVDVAPVLDVLDRRGYAVQSRPDLVVVQRRAADDDEAAAILLGLERLGRAPTALERRGVHAAYPFLAVPAGTVAPDLGELASAAGAIRT